jgi:hypothetical protein
MDEVGTALGLYVAWLDAEPVIQSPPMNMDPCQTIQHRFHNATRLKLQVSDGSTRYTLD